MFHWTTRGEKLIEMRGNRPWASLFRLTKMWRSKMHDQSFQEPHSKLPTLNK